MTKIHNIYPWGQHNGRPNRTELFFAGANLRYQRALDEQFLHIYAETKGYMTPQEELRLV